MSTHTKVCEEKWYNHENINVQKGSQGKVAQPDNIIHMKACKGKWHNHEPTKPASKGPQSGPTIIQGLRPQSGPQPIPGRRPQGGPSSYYDHVNSKVTQANKHAPSLVHPKKGKNTPRKHIHKKEGIQKNSIINQIMRVMSQKREQHRNAQQQG